MRVFVTGGAGFLGGALLALARGEVFAPPRAALDVRDEPALVRALAAFQPQLVLHLAALTDVRRAESEPELALAVNAEGAAAVARATLRAAPAARLVHVSTCHVYAPPGPGPVSEAHPLAPRGAYARSKAEGEARVRAHHPRALLVRPFNLLGPGQPRQHAVADWILQAAAGVEALRVGDLSLRRDYTDVRDCAEGLLLLAERGEEGGVYNLCRGEAVSMAWLAEQAAPGVPKLPDPARLRAGETPLLVGDSGRARALGWVPQRPLTQSVADLRLELLRRVGLVTARGA